MGVLFILTFLVCFTALLLCGELAKSRRERTGQRLKLELIVSDCEQCIEGVLRTIQTSGICDELLVVDDGSTDQTLEIARRMMRFPQGRGVFVAVRGLAFADNAGQGCGRRVYRVRLAKMRDAREALKKIRSEAKII